MAGNVGIIGRARTGKDTAGAWLVKERGYVRVSFADPLKEAALRLDPVVANFPDEDTHVPIDVRLSEVVRAIGWDEAKDHTPEIRRILQELGMAVRAIDPEFWIRAALAKVQEANEAGQSAVITDVRFPNEAATLKREGFHLVYIDRPGVPLLDHASEGALTADDADYYILNNRDIYDLHQELVEIDDCVVRLESAKQYARSFD